MPVGRSSHWWRLELQYNFAGAGKSGSLKQPTDTHTIPGSTSSRAKTVTPHVGQKFDSFQRPDSEERRQRVELAGDFHSGFRKEGGVRKRAAAAALTIQAGAGVNDLRRRR